MDFVLLFAKNASHLSFGGGGDCCCNIQETECFRTVNDDIPHRTDLSIVVVVVEFVIDHRKINSNMNINLTLF